VGHPHIDNDTPFAFEPLFVSDEELRPVVVLIVKATFGFDSSGVLRLADEQIPVNVSGERWSDAEASSYKYEPETALCKLSTDVALIGHARPPHGGVKQIDVTLKVGPVQKTARVTGSRYWVWTKYGVVMSSAADLRTVPLTWENAFGGRDEARSTPACEVLEPRNPVGTGFGTPLTKEGDRVRLPNIEDPNQLIDRYGASVAPTGFGFTSPNWAPRAGFAGTYDDHWAKTRKPLLPVDFDRRFFNGAAPGLVASGYLRGDEDVVVLNASPTPQLAFRLPGVPPPRCRVVVRGSQDTELMTNLDTVIVNADEQQLILLWRAFTGGGPHDVSVIAIGTPQ